MSKLKQVGELHAYISSNGKETLLTQMTYSHLDNAIKKLEREDPHSEDLTILKEELASRPPLPKEEE